MRKLMLTMVLAVPAFAQTLTVKDALVKHWKVTADFTMAVADKMPADSYGFKPVPEELSFGQLVIQIAVANVGACANASGMPRVATPDALAQALKDEKKDVDKATAMKYLGDTFKFCNDAVASMTQEKLEALTGSSTRKLSGFEWLWAYFTHTAHHRGQAEVYLRVKGIKPPDYTF